MNQKIEIMKKIKIKMDTLAFIERAIGAQKKKKNIFHSIESTYIRFVGSTGRLVC